jgi:hypothetical protein
MSWLLYVYLAGIIPAIVACGWYNQREGIHDDVPAIFNGLGWPLLVLVLGIIVPVVFVVGWLFEQPARVGAWAARRWSKKTV